MFGENAGDFLYHAVRGQIYEPFERKTKSHSISAEKTFSYDITDLYTLETSILELCHGIMFRLLRENGFSRTAFVKIRYEDFSTVSIQKTYSKNILTLDFLYKAVKELFEEKWESNEFAYNIAVDFVSKDQRNDDHLIICISMDQAARNTQIINNLLTDLEYRNFSSTVLFVYDLSRKFMRVRTYNGIENYLKTLDTSKNTSALILKLEGSNTELISSGWNYTAPSWMLSNGFDAFIQNGLSDYLPLYLTLQGRRVQ